MKRIIYFVLIFFLITNIVAEELYYNNGLSAYKAGKFKVARDMLNKSNMLEEDDCSKLFFIANSYFFEEDYKSAIEYYNKVQKKCINIDKFDLLNTTKFLTAECLFYLGEFEKAEKIYSELLLVNNPVIHMLSLYGKIISLFNLSKYTSALSSISLLKSKLLKVNFDATEKINEQISFILAETWYRKSNLKNAQREFQKFIDMYPNSDYIPYANLRLTQILTKNKDYTSAENFAKDINLEKFKSDTQILIKYNYSKLLIQQQKYNEAIESNKDLLKLSKDEIFSDLLKFDNAYCYYKLNEFSKATSLLNKLSNSKEKTIAMNSLYLLGIINYCSKQYMEAINVFNKFTEKYYRKTNLLDDVNYWLSLSYLNNSNYEKAINGFKYLVDKKSSIYSTPSEFFLAVCYIRIKEYELAKSILNGLISKGLNKDFETDVIYQLAECYRFLCDYDVAKQYYEKIISENRSKMTEAKISLADIFLRYDQFEKAEKMICEVLKQNTNKENIDLANLLLFTVYLNKKEYDNALSVSKKLTLSNLPKDKRLFLSKAVMDIYIKNADYENAIQYSKFLLENIDTENKFQIELKYINLLFLSGKETEALNKCNEVLKKSSKPSEKLIIYFNLVSYYNSRKDEEKIKNLLKEIVFYLDVNSFDFFKKQDIFDFLNITINYDLDSTIKIVERVVQNSYLSSQEVSDILVKVIEICFNKEKYSPALKFCAMLKQIASDKESLIFSEYIIGKIYEAQNKLVFAENVYKNIIEKYKQENSTVKVYISLIKLLESQNRKEEAKSYEYVLFEKFEDNDNTYEYIYETAKICEQNKDYQEAVNRYNKVINAKDINLRANAQKKLGDCYFNLKLFKEASVEYLKTVYLYPQFNELCAEAQFMVGVCCEKLNLKDEAKKAFKNSTVNFPGTLWAQEAEMQLKSLK